MAKLDFKQIKSKLNYKVIILILVSLVLSTTLSTDTSIAEPYKSILLNLSNSLFVAAILYFVVELNLTSELYENIKDVYQDVLFDAKSLNSSLSKDFTDKALRNSLEKTLGNEQISEGILLYIRNVAEIYDKGYLEDYDETTHIEIDPEDENYYILNKSVSYCRYNLPNKLIFQCKLEEGTEKGEQFIHTYDSEISWSFLKHSGATKLPINSFIVSNVELDGSPIKLNLEESDKLIKYSFNLPRSSIGKSGKLKFLIKVKQAKQGGFYSVATRFPIKNMKIDFEAESNTNIDEVYAITHGAISTANVEIRDLKNCRKAIRIYGWSLPFSESIFSWIK